MIKLLSSALMLSIMAVTSSTNANEGILFSDVWKNGGEFPKDHPLLKPKISPDDKVLGGELFQPTLEEFKQSKLSNNNTLSGLLYEDEVPPNRVDRVQSDLSTQIEQQYFFKYAQHSKIDDSIADDMRTTTGGKGDIWISTRIDKIHPAKWNSEKKKSEHQCADVAMRMTHDEVPLKTDVGIKYVTFWQDFKQQICHSKDVD